MVYKTLVTIGQSKKIYVFVIGVLEELDLKKCAKAVKEKSIEMKEEHKTYSFEMPDYNIRVESIWQKRTNPETSTTNNSQSNNLLLCAQIFLMSVTPFSHPLT